MNTAKKNKTNELVKGSLISTIKDLQVVTLQLHPAYNDPKHDLDNCHVCQAISAAKTILTIHKA